MAHLAHVGAMACYTVSATTGSLGSCFGLLFVEPPITGIQRISRGRPQTWAVIHVNMCAIAVLCAYPQQSAKCEKLVQTRAWHARQRMQTATSSCRGWQKCLQEPQLQESTTKSCQQQCRCRVQRSPKKTCQTHVKRETLVERKRQRPDTTVCDI